MSLSTALLTDSQSRLWTWLFGQPERSFHWNELRRLTQLGSASLQRELNRLVEAQVVTSTPLANTKQFQANANSPVFGELVALTRKTLGLAPQLQSALTPLHNQLQLALIYGSVAKQTDTSSSDIDLLLVGADLRLGAVLELLTPLEALWGRKINPTCYSPAEFERRRTEPDSFVKRVLAQDTLLLVGAIP